MAQAAYDEETEARTEGKKLDWRKRMSDHIAYALMVYTALQIFVTVALVIPACKTYESCWMKMSDEQAADPSYEPRYRKSVIGLWVVAIGLPFLLAGLFKALYALN